MWVLVTKAKNKYFGSAQLIKILKSSGPLVQKVRRSLVIRYILMPVNIAINNNTYHLLSLVSSKNSSTKDPPMKTSKKSVPVRKVFSFHFPSFEKGHCWAQCSAMLFSQCVLPSLSCSVRQRKEGRWLVVNLELPFQCVFLSIIRALMMSLAVITEGVCVRVHILSDKQRGTLFDKSQLVSEEFLPFCASVALVRSSHLSFVYRGSCGTKGCCISNNVI